jgi:predicted amidohydrolase
VRRHVAYIDEAADVGADLLVFPEISLQGYPGRIVTRGRNTMRDFMASAEPVPDGPNVRALLDHAAERGIHVVFGVAESGHRPSVLYNTAVFGGPDGYIGSFRKGHLGLYEHVLFRNGADWPVFPTDLGTVGIMICYDLHWPEAARELTLRGADILVVPKAWPGGDMFEEHQLLFERTRALENHRWLVSSNYAGPFTGVDYPGNTRVIDPLGRVVADSGPDPGLAIATVDLAGGVLDRVTAYGGGVALIRDRRPETYRALRGELETVVDA